MWWESAKPCTMKTRLPSLQRDKSGPMAPGKPPAFKETAGLWLQMGQEASGPGLVHPLALGCQGWCAHSDDLSTVRGQCIAGS